MCVCVCAWGPVYIWRVRVLNRERGESTLLQHWKELQCHKMSISSLDCQWSEALKDSLTGTLCTPLISIHLFSDVDLNTAPKHIEDQSYRLFICLPKPPVDRHLMVESSVHGLICRFARLSALLALSVLPR